jgi:hypothetical protein
MHVLVMCNDRCARLAQFDHVDMPTDLGERAVGPHHWVGADLNRPVLQKGLPHHDKNPSIFTRHYTAFGRYKYARRAEVPLCPRNTSKNFGIR